MIPPFNLGNPGSHQTHILELETVVKQLIEVVNQHEKRLKKHQKPVAEDPEDEA